MSGKRYLVIGYEVKDGPKEFTSIRGYALKIGEHIPTHKKIRRDCLDWANKYGDSFSYFKINFMQFMGEDDYNSFMEIECKN